MTGIVILDYNNAFDTINCIKSVDEYTEKGTYKIVVVENGSNKKNVENIRHFIEANYNDNYKIINEGTALFNSLPLITLMIGKENEGYARGNNKALDLFNQDEEVEYVMILNNDVLFVEDIINPLVLKLNEIPDCGLISPLLVKKDGKTIDYCCARNEYPKIYFFLEQALFYKDLFGLLNRCRRNSVILGVHPELLNEGYFEIGMPSGSCMLIKKDLFKQIGYFDNNTFLYFEENILFHKIKKNKKRNYLVPTLKCIHLGASSTSKNFSSFVLRCQIDSEIYYLRKYRNAYLLAVLVRVMSYATLLKLKTRDFLKSIKC